MEFGVTVASHKGWEVLTVTGEIDMATAPRFRQRLLALISGGAQNVVIDLSGVDYIDSTGLGVLMGGAKRVRSTGGDIRLVTTGSRLADLIELTRLDRVLDVFDSVSAATESSDSCHPTPPNSTSRFPLGRNISRWFAPWWSKPPKWMHP